MALLEADFEMATEGFGSAWRVSSVGVDDIIRSGEQHGEQRDWDDVEKVC
jgi:hypothetical protein